MAFGTLLPLLHALACFTPASHLAASAPVRRRRSSPPSSGHITDVYTPPHLLSSTFRLPTRSSPRAAWLTPLARTHFTISLGCMNTLRTSALTPACLRRHALAFRITAYAWTPLGCTLRDACSHHLRHHASRFDNGICAPLSSLRNVSTVTWFARTLQYHLEPVRRHLPAVDRRALRYIAARYAHYTPYTHHIQAGTSALHLSHAS